MKVRARVKFSSEEFKNFEKMLYGGDSFLVVREGINDEPREMRFGKTIWSENDEVIKFQIYLIDRSHDTGEKSLGLFEPEMTNIQAMLIRTTESLINLLNILEKKALLTSEERQSVKDIEREHLLSRISMFSEVDNLDELPLK